MRAYCGYLSFQALQHRAAQLYGEIEMCKSLVLKALHMHGGIGMTDEFDIGFFLKRCRILENLYGGNYFHLDRFARQRDY